MARTAGQLSFICFWSACPRQTLLVWQPHTQALRPNASGRGLARLGIIVSNATIWAKGDLPPLPTYRQGRPPQARL